MALWNDFGKKAGETMRGFGARAREIAETTKINGQIAIKRTDIERLYGEIGKAYFTINAGRSQDAGALDELCAKVKELDTEIADMQRKIDTIRQVRRCPVCGEVSPNTARFCGACGAKFEVETPTEPKPEEESNQETPAEQAEEDTLPSEEMAEEQAEEDSLPSEDMPAEDQTEEQPAAGTDEKQ